MVKLNINTIKRISFDRNGQGKIEGSFENLVIKINQKTVATRALKSLLDKARTLDLDIDTQMELFQRCVMPILLYGCEVWGYEKNNIKSLDVFYKRFIKTILDIYSFTPTCMVFGEAGQPNLYDLIKQRLISFCGKLEFDAKTVKTHPQNNQEFE